MWVIMEEKDSENSREHFFQPIQPNLWTVLIDDFLSFYFLFLRKKKCLSLTLPNEMPKESLKATGYAVF